MTNLKEIVKKSLKLKLLYVEDNVDARESTHELLSDFFMDITLGVNGEDGLEKFKNSNFDLVITDINMPRMNGLEMAKAIKELDSSVKIIVVSAHNENSYIKKGENFIDGYLFKPLNMSQFLQEIQKVVK